MNAPNGSTGKKGLSEWWLTPPRSGLQRWINPWVYRHLQGFGVTHVAGGGLQVAAGAICLAYGIYGWAAFFLVLAALNFAGGSWYLAIARSASAEA